MWIFCFSQNFYSGKAISKNIIGYGGLKRMKWMAFYDKYYEYINYFNLMASGFIQLVWMKYVENFLLYIVKR